MLQGVTYRDLIPPYVAAMVIVARSEDVSMSDFNDPLDDILGSPVRFAPVVPRMSVPAAEMHFEKCYKCGGTGQVRWGKCFACNGKGGKSFKQDYQTRAHNRELAADRKVRTQESIKEAFAARYPAESAWIAAKEGSFDFARAMGEAVVKYGDLTDRQLAAVRSCMARDAARQEEYVARKANAPVVTIEAIEAAFSKAVASGVRSPKLRLDSFVFSPAKAHSANAGAIYVKEGDTYLGKIMGGKLHRAFACTDEQQAKIVTVAADPASAAKAYGKRYGSCSVCGRELTDGNSIDAGIGPICASKYGF